jgi:hypothetical protein
MKADAKPTLDDVAKLIARGPPPEWLSPALGFFSNMIRDSGITSDQRKEHADEIDRLKNAINTLRRLLPLFLVLPFGERPELNRGPVDVLVVLDALPRIERLLEVNLRPEKRTPDFNRKCCCAVILEAARLIQPEVQHRSKETYLAYNAYWKACGNQAIVENRNWDRSINRALEADNAWIREIFQQLQTLRMAP